MKQMKSAKYFNTHCKLWDFENFLRDPLSGENLEKGE